jgi:hypothetical protein
MERRAFSPVIDDEARQDARLSTSKLGFSRGD